MKVRVLIVDETAFVRDALKRSLRSFLAASEIFDANNGQRGLAQLRQSKIHLVFCAWQLPDMAGAEFLTAVRDVESHEKTPMIVMVDEMARDTVVKVVDAGASDVMAKPFSPGDVQKRVNKQLARLGIKAATRDSNTSQSGFASLDVLTGGSSSPGPQGVDTVTSAPSENASAKNRSPRSKALSLIRWTDQKKIAEIIDLSNKGLSVRLSRKELPLPSIFDPVTVEVRVGDESPMGPFDAFVLGLHALRPEPDAKHIQINLRFTQGEQPGLNALGNALRSTP